MEKQSLIPWGGGSSTCQYWPPRALQTSNDCQHVRLYALSDQASTLYRLRDGGVLISLCDCDGYIVMASELEVCWKTPARWATASLLHDAQSQAGRMLHYCLAKEWDASGLHLGSVPILWSLTCYIYEDCSFLLLQKIKVEGRRWKCEPEMNVFNISVCFVEVETDKVSRLSSLLNPQHWNLQRVKEKRTFLQMPLSNHSSKSLSFSVTSEMDRWSNKTFPSLIIILSSYIALQIAQIVLCKRKYHYPYGDAVNVRQLLKSEVSFI